LPATGVVAKNKSESPPGDPRRRKTHPCRPWKISTAEDDVDDDDDEDEDDLNLSDNECQREEQPGI
jgi:hypothetical protein